MAIELQTGALSGGGEPQYARELSEVSAAGDMPRHAGGRRGPPGLARRACWLATCVVCSVTAAEPLFVRLAEGYTSKDARAGIVVAPRMFSAPTFAELCSRHQLPSRLLVMTPEPLRLSRGQWFPYDRLVVLAVDSSGRILPPVPIVVEAEETTPELLDLRSDMTADLDGKVLPVREGSFQFRLRTICDNHGAAATIDAEVTDP